jgi:hypothetical protein
MSGATRRSRAAVHARLHKVSEACPVARQDGSLGQDHRGPGGLPPGQAPELERPRREGGQQQQQHEQKAPDHAET